MYIKVHFQFTRKVFRLIFVTANPRNIRKNAVTYCSNSTKINNLKKKSHNIKMYKVKIKQEVLTQELGTSTHH